MNHTLPYFWALCTLSILSLVSPPAQAYEIARPDLMNVARDFVNRIGQKMQGQRTQERKETRIPENELLILQPRIGDRVMIEGSFGAYYKNKNLYLSLRELIDTLRFPIRMDIEKGTADGWFIAERNNFAMDLGTGQVVSRGVAYTTGPEEWFRADGEIFVRQDLIRDWMGITGDLKIEYLILDLKSEEPFPLENKLARRKRSLQKDGPAKEPVLPRIDNPYRIASVPAVDVALGAAYRRNATGTSSSAITQNISSAGDFLGMTARTFTTMNRDHGVETFRFSAEKNSDAQDLLGPLRARQYELGDIFPTELSGTGGGDTGFGFRATNAEDNTRLGATTRTFEGDSPPDWDVELYDGLQLVAFQTTGGDGRYKFSDIELFAGENDFRLVFYGPQGEIREEDVSIPISIEEVGSDKGLYDISLTLNNVQTYEYDPSEDPDKGAPHLVVSYQQGIRDGLSAHGGLRVHQANEDWKALAKGGVIARVGKTLLNIDAVTDEELESSFQLTARRSFHGHDARSLAYFATSDFDPNNGGGVNTIFRNQNTLRGDLLSIFGATINYTVDTNYSLAANDASNFSAQFSQNARLGRYTLGHGLTYSRSETSDGIATTAYSSTFSGRRSFGKTRVRTSGTYQYAPDPQWQEFELNISRYLRKNLLAEMEIAHTPGNDKTEVMARLNWTNDYFILSPRLTYNTDHEIQATVNMRFGLTYDAFGHTVNMTRDTVTGKGGVHAFVYLDRNGNRQFDGDDEAVPEVRVISAQNSKNRITDERGIALFNDLPEYRATDILVDRASLPDPYYVVGFEGLSVYPRPGAPVKIDFPLHLSGEMDGTVFKPGRRGPEGASGLRVQLYNMKGELASSSLAAFDGFYVISTIPPGDYYLMVHPDDLAQTGLRQPWPRKITIGYDGKVLAGEDIMLEQGDEVPMKFARAPKIEAGKKGAVAPEQTARIEIQMGSYRSGLLAQVMKLRIARTLRAAHLAPIAPETRETLSGKRPAQELVTTLSPDRLVDARNICTALLAEGLPCTLVLPPAALARQSDPPPKPKIAKNASNRPDQG